MKRTLSFFLLMTLLLSLLVSCTVPGGTAATVSSCEFISEEGGVETWRLTYSNGTTTDMTVRGRGNAASLSVTSCEKASTAGLTDTYRITFSDGATADFSVTNGAAGLPGATGAAGSSPTVVSCEKIAESTECATWRLTFSDGATADFTTPVAGGSGDGWQDVLTKVDTLFAALDIKKLPSKTVGNRTVTDGGAANTTENLSSTFTGWASLMTKDVMFGTADTVYGITLKGYRIEEGKADTVPVDIHLIDISEGKPFYESPVFKTYTAEVTPAGLGDYLLEVEIPKADLEGLGDVFMLGFETRNATRVGMKASRNIKSFRVESELLDKTFQSGSNTYYTYSGYYTLNDAGKRGIACATTKNAPDLFFSTAYDEEYSFTGSIGDPGADSEDTAVNDLLRLPEQYDLVVGDTFELFYKGITFCADAAAYDYSVSFAGGERYGKAFSRKWTFTPTAADIGVHTMQITLWSNEGKILDTEKVKLNIVAAPTSPEEEKVVLIIGDSLTSGGVWPKELQRRLTATGGTPEGLGLSNISFIGSKEKDGVRYEGYGGWNFDSYTTANLRNDFMILTGDFRDKVEAVDQHSTYKDSKNQNWKIEWVTATEMKIICTSASGALPSTEGGTLTHVSGGINHGDIVYTSARRADANPFWDSDAEANDFVAYAEKYGKTRIDEVILFMGWNEYARTPAEFKTRAARLIDSILADFPDCHISLVGLQIPSRDGFAQNYGITWPWFPMLEKVFAFEDSYRALAADAKYAGRLSVVSVAGQYDAEYNEQKASSAVNNRNPQTEVIGSNGVHPSNYGYLQIADAIYRHMCERLSK